MITKKRLQRYIDRGLTIWQIMEIEQVSRSTVYNYVRKYKAETPKRFYATGVPMGRPKGIPMSDEQKALRSELFAGEGNPFYGRTHSEETQQKMSDNHADFTGDKNPFRRSLISDPQKRQEHKERCHAIWSKRDQDYRRRFGEKSKTGYQEISGTFWARVRSNARVRGIPVQVTPKQIWEIYLAQDGRCALSGVYIGFSKEETTASLDRIDSDLAYTIDNVQWVHKLVNIMKGKTSEDEFIYFCSRIVQWQDI